MFWDRKFWKEKSSCIIFLQEKFRSQKGLCKRLWDKEIGDKFVDTKFQENESKKQKELKKKFTTYKS